jgi:mono/diheme cytochrome c family protein
MKIQTISLLAATAVAFGAVTTAIAAAPRPVTNDAADGAFAAGGKFGENNGEQMYRRVCAACHMPDAKGAIGAGYYPALAKNPKLEAGGYPLSVLMQGLNGMPPLGKMMTDQQAADTVNYVRTHFGNKYKDKVTAEDAKALR